MTNNPSPAILLHGIAFVLETQDDSARQRFQNILAEFARREKKPVLMPQGHEERMSIALSGSMPDLEGMRVRHHGFGFPGMSATMVPGPEVVGYFEHAENTLHLNTAYSDAELAATFAKLASHAFVAKALGAVPMHGHILVSSDELPRLMLPPGHVLIHYPPKPKPPQP